MLLSPLLISVDAWVVVNVGRSFFLAADAVGSSIAAAVRAGCCVSWVGCCVPWCRSVLLSFAAIVAFGAALAISLSPLPSGQLLHVLVSLWAGLLFFAAVLISLGGAAPAISDTTAMSVGCCLCCCCRC